MIVLLFWVFYQDLKERLVSIYLFLGLIGIGSFLNFKAQILADVFLINSLFNIAAVLLITLVLYLYSRYKMKLSFFQEAFGLGDLVFFLFMAISFPPLSFLILFSASVIFSFVISIGFQRQLKKKIPLAGLQALFLGVMITANLCFNLTNLYAF